MARHKQFTMATDMAGYFRDSAGLWQRGWDEEPNGLLRQCFPRGADLSVHDPEDLDRRPRKTLGWVTPAERLRDLLTTSTTAVLRRPSKPRTAPGPSRGVDQPSSGTSSVPKW
jgi:IS30 family transposase